MNQASGLDLLKIVSPGWASERAGGREGAPFPAAPLPQTPTLSPWLPEELGRGCGARAMGMPCPVLPGVVGVARTTLRSRLTAPFLPSGRLAGFACIPGPFPFRRERAGDEKVFIFPFPLKG